ncbi:hypothetical protein A0H76_576 [Hepatospora eriocheir]|uniref:Uncharacterized protein n=1 Tax=Hepatospora eriocheir TaxID=1081669 RepID=A0A1X0Q831_9MICR|nr:hypothetical protein A0H76_576 [Hepatospora eriocheir]
MNIAINFIIKIFAKYFNNLQTTIEPQQSSAELLKTNAEVLKNDEKVKMIKFKINFNFSITKNKSWLLSVNNIINL